MALFKHLRTMSIVINENENLFPDDD
jgi:hypothetical protein